MMGTDIADNVAGWKQVIQVKWGSIYGTLRRMAYCLNDTGLTERVGACPGYRWLSEWVSS